MNLNLSKTSVKVILGLVVLFLIGVSVLLLTVTKEREVDVSPNSLKIHGIWGLEIAKDQISTVTMQDKFPTIIRKTNGAGIGDKLFGKFEIQGFNNSRLFIGDKTKPYVAIHLNDNALILINYKDEVRTKSLFDSISSFMNIK